MSKNPRLSNPSALPRGGSSRIVNKGQAGFAPEVTASQKYLSPRSTPHQTLATSTSRGRVPPPSQLDRNDLKRISLRSRAFLMFVKVSKASFLLISQGK